MQQKLTIVGHLKFINVSKFIQREKTSKAGCVEQSPGKCTCSYSMSNRNSDCLGQPERPYFACCTAGVTLLRD